MDKKSNKSRKHNFFDICNDSSYFEREYNIRHYAICVNCGFIPMSMIDKDTKFLDLHCKCGCPAIYTSFTEEEILAMIDSMP